MCILQTRIVFHSNKFFFSKMYIVVCRWKAFLKWNKKLVRTYIWKWTGNELHHFRYLPNQWVCLKGVCSKFSILNNWKRLFFLQCLLSNSTCFETKFLMKRLSFCYFILFLDKSFYPCNLAIYHKKSINKLLCVRMS